MFATLKLRLDEREVEKRKLGITCNREGLWKRLSHLHAISSMRSFILRFTVYRLIGRPSTLVGHKNARQTRGIWKRRLYVLVWTEKPLKNGALRNRWHNIIMWFPCPESKVTCRAFKFPRAVVKEKHLICFQREISVFKSLRCSVDWA